MQIKNLFLIGNGFDIWQGIPSSYEKFRLYYRNNIDRVLEEMSISRIEITDEEGNAVKLTPVNLIFGNPFDPGELPSDFFWTLEDSMNKVDDQLLNLYFGRDKKGLKKLNKTLSQGRRILQRIFSEWIVSLNIQAVSDCQYNFGDDCFFINFNYTDTLEKRFGVPPENIFHIHGNAIYPETIVVGHASHPEKPFDELIEQKFIVNRKGGRSPRLEGLFYVESILYETDKHIQDKLNELFLYMAEKNICIEEIENIYVLGMSLSDPDVEYINTLYQATKTGCNLNGLSALGKLHKNNPFEDIDEDKLMEDIALNIEYATHRRERELKKKDLPFPEEEAFEKMMNILLYGKEKIYDNDREKKAQNAVYNRFLLEQASRDREALERLCRSRRIKQIPDIGKFSSVPSMVNYLDGGHTLRLKDAKWTVSFHSEKDEKRINTVMQKIGCKNFVAENSIEKCIKDFKA